jgi:NADH-quinone oxidoreductase subunit L
MTAPLAILAVCAILLGFLGTPAWPWFQSFLEGHAVEPTTREPGLLAVMLTSSVIALLGIFLGYLIYGRQPATRADAPDPISHLQPRTFRFLHHAYFIDALYAATFVRLTRWLGYLADILDRFLFNGVVQVVSFAVLALAWLDSFVDNYIVNLGFDTGWRTISTSGRALALLQGGRVQAYLRYIGLALVGLVIFLLWGAAR